MKSIAFRPEGDEVGGRVDAVLARRAEVTRTLAQKALRSGDVTVNATPVRPSYRLEGGDEVRGDLPDPTFAVPEAEEIPLHVAYDDARVLVVSKPAGLVTHPARGHEEGTLVNALLGLGGALAGEGSSRPGIVHRLDKDTSGLLLVARDDEAAEHLVAAIRDRSVERRYYALVRGEMAATSGTIEAPLGRHPTRRRLMAVVPEGRPSVTHYEILDASAGVSLLDVKLETGRTHQIRVHLAHVGHPIMGDRTYGGMSEAATALGLSRPFLHAYRLVFPHPSDNRPIEVTDPLPEDLLAALAAAGLRPPRLRA